MSFGSSMRFEVKEGGKGGIFWQKEKPKQNQKKFGYKSKQLRHAIRKPEVEYIEQPVAKPDPSKDFIKKNRSQFQRPTREEDKENQSRNSTRYGHHTSEIKPGTVTLTQDQLNALLATVGKLTPSEASNLRISIDGENNRLQVETPRDNQDSVPNSSRSDPGSVQEDGNIFGLLKKDANSEPADNRDSSGYNSEDRSGGKKEVQFDTARNVERTKTPEPSPGPPAMVPWKHMTVGERKRLQWAREKAAEEEEQRKIQTYHDRGQQMQELPKEYNPWGRPGGGAPPQKSEKETKKEDPQEEYNPWGRPGGGAPPKKPEPERETEFRTKDDDELRKAIDVIEAKYGKLLYPEKEEGKSHSASRGISREERDRHTKKTDSAGIPGLDESYAPDSKSGEKGKASKSSKKRLEDRGNARPSRKQDRREDDRERDRGRDKQRKSERQRKEEELAEAEAKIREEAEAKIREEAERRSAAAGPSAMQSSLFMGEAEPDNSRFLSKKEQERKRWLEELDRQREEKRLEKQREKAKQREGVDDMWADRFVSEEARRPAQSRAPPQAYQQPPPAPFASGGTYDNRPGHQSRMSEDSYSTLPPAAMRSAMAIGDVAPNMDRIEQKKAEEKRLWLEELNKQREEQREARMRLKDKQKASQDTWADRFTEDPRTAAAVPSTHNAPVAYDAAPSSYQDSTGARVNSAPQPAVTDSFDEQNRTYLRGQNVHLDAVTRREMEEKRHKHLEYQAAIKAQIEEKEKQKRMDRESKWKEEIEEEKKLQAERDFQKNQLEAEDNKHKQKEEARQRQVDHLKSLMDAEQGRAQEERMIKRLTALKQAGHDVSGLKAHYEDADPYNRHTPSQALSLPGLGAITPRINQASINTASVPGLQPSPRDYHGANYSPRGLASTYRAGEGPLGGTLPRESGTSQHYVENRVLTPSRLRTSQNHLDFATQTDEELEHLAKLHKELSEVEIEYRERQGNNTNNRAGAAGGRNARTQSADRKKPAENPRGKPPLSRPGAKQKPAPQHPLKGKPTQWNYQNPKKKVPVKQSEKDPFYERKRQESEERRAKRERQLQYLVELNKQVIPTERQHNPRSNHPHSPRDPGSDFAADSRLTVDRHEHINHGDLSHRSSSPPVNRTGGKYRPVNRSRSPPPAARQNRTDLRDFDTGHDTQALHSHRRRDPRGFSPMWDERGNISVPIKDTDFIPIMRTTDILDPSRAEDPLQLSRENTHIKQARKHYQENLHPADYGNQLAMYEDKQRVPTNPSSKDPILNPGLVKDFPTARQDQILQQLSTLKQSLIQRQREIETCMSPSDLAMEKQV